MGTFLFHGKIWLGEDRFAQAIVIRGGRVAAVGEDERLRRTATGEEAIDCGGRTVIPGLNDACLSLKGLMSPEEPFPHRGRALRHSLREGLRRAALMGLTAVQLYDFGRTLPWSALPQLEKLCREERRLPRVRCYRPLERGGSLPKVPLKELGMPAKGALLCHGEERDSPQGLFALMDWAERRGEALRVAARTWETVELLLQKWETLPEKQALLRRMGMVGCPETRVDQLRRMGRLGLGVIYFPGELERDLTAAAGKPELAPENCCAFRTASALGARIAFGGGEGLTPFAGIQAAVTRAGTSPVTGREIPSGERLTVAQALEAYTVGSAWMEYGEDFYGALRPGYCADLLVLDRDIFTCPPGEIGGARPLLVMREGAVLYRSGM